jgi:outer membrane protein assembly factor BamB
MPATGIYATNFGAAAYDNGQVFAVNSDGTMNAFDASTGHLNWMQKGLGTGIPVAVNGVVYEGSVTAGAQGGQAVSEADGHITWSHNNLSTSGQHPSVTFSGVYLTDWCENN